MSALPTSGCRQYLHPGVGIGIYITKVDNLIEINKQTLKRFKRILPPPVLFCFSSAPLQSRAFFTPMQRRNKWGRYDAGMRQVWRRCEADKIVLKLLNFSFKYSMICSPHRPDLRIGILIRIKYGQKRGRYKKIEELVLKIQLSIHENISLQPGSYSFFHTQTIFSCSSIGCMLAHKQTWSQYANTKINVENLPKHKTVPSNWLTTTCEKKQFQFCVISHTDFKVWLPVNGFIYLYSIAQFFILACGGAPPQHMTRFIRFKLHKSQLFNQRQHTSASLYLIIHPIRTIYACIIIIRPPFTYYIL